MTASPLSPAPGRERLLLSRRAGVSLQSRRRSSSMPLTSTPECPCEVHRDRRVRRLRCADVFDDGRGLARLERAAPGCEPVRRVTVRLASGFVRVCRLYDCALVDDTYRRAL